MTRARHALAFLAIVVGAVVGSEAPASAHAQLTETTPVDDEIVAEIPEEVGLRFDEPMDAAPDAIRVLGPDGERVDASTTRLSDDGTALDADMDPAGRGTYTVAWRATSKDGHTLTGSFVFHVEVRTGAQDVDLGRPPSVTAASGVGRWTGFAGGLTAIGAIVLALRSEAVARARLRRLTLAAAGLATVGTALLLVAETASSSGRSLVSAPSVVIDIGLGARTGQLLAWRTALLALATVAALPSVVWRRAPFVPLAAVVPAMVLTSAGGHAWTVGNRAAAVAVDSVHLLAAGAWVGGLLALLVALPVTADRPKLIRRFSTTTLGLVVVVAVSGVVSGLFQVPNLSALTGTTYGQVLLAKVALFSLLVLIGWVNRRHIVPRVERLTATLARNVKVEVAVAALLLAVTAGLVEQVPARVAFYQPVDVVVRTDEATMQVTIDPARVGENTIHLYFYDSAGSTPLAIDALELTARVGDVPPRRLTVVPVAPNHVTVYSATLGAPGTWTLDATAISGSVPMTFTAQVPIR